ncbi:hypothetical protein OG599_09295 [Streptomyces sp. NBC_01335]|uniref:hypothetical protein n=1 Tax=Streptomyces sp. NBC_01335 TaxID=2903828 RepID=UPI002E151ED6|nr:hypothetical protein OG599_09295 [Streptomyces sp. NBC_01335]
MDLVTEVTRVFDWPGGPWRTFEVHHLSRRGVSLYANADRYEFHVTFPVDHTEADLQWALLEAAALDLELIPEVDDEVEILGDGDYLRIHLIPSNNQEAPCHL